MEKDYQSSILMHMTSILRQEVEEKGGSFEFAESIRLTGRYGDKCATKHLFVKDGKLHAHVYSGWQMENPSVCLEYESNYLSEDTLRHVTNLVHVNWH